MKETYEATVRRRVASPGTRSGEQNEPSEKRGFGLAPVSAASTQPREHLLESISDAPNQGLTFPAESFPDMACLKARDERLQALRNLAGHLAHDLNNSLMPLVAYTALLDEEFNDGAPGKQYLVKLSSSVKRSGDLIDAILRATHPERHFYPQNLDLASLLERTAGTFVKSLPASTQISVETEFASCQLCLDEDQWTRVIEQLLSNARTALANEGRLRVALQARTIAPEQAAELGLAQTALIELLVEDTGCGMSEDVLRQACDPFFSTHSNSTTSGLGLTMVHSVVRLHGGQLILESELAVGTRIRIWLPSENA
jgi:signal transduction histidine kinase